MLSSSGGNLENRFEECHKDGNAILFLGLLGPDWAAKQGEILPAGDQSERKRIIRDRGAISISVKPGKAVNRPRPGTTFSPVVGGIEGSADASRRLLERE
jgi:hypothetical protein